MGAAILLIQATAAVDPTIIDAQKIIEIIIAQILLEKAEGLHIRSLEEQTLGTLEIIILIIEIIPILLDIDRIMIPETFSQVVRITSQVDF